MKKQLCPISIRHWQTSCRSSDTDASKIGFYWCVTTSDWHNIPPGFLFCNSL